ncbi:MAG: sulfatase [Planctomycetota bacterium]
MVCLSLVPCEEASGQTESRPNILWIMSEDNSKHYIKHFDRHGAETPAIESLARHGVTFDRAFSCAPVCSVARTTLITSCYAPRVGTQFHRRSKMATLPKGLKMFPAYLRAAGYYTTNNSKEDYNAAKSADVWDESSRRASWKNRPSDSTPFFHVLTTTLSHESSLHFDATVMEERTVADQQAVQLQPYFPDTATFRYTRARYHDRMLAVDQVVRDTVADLEKAGVLEDTFIFYFGDHGGVLPRSKGYAYESGLHIPLIVRVPKNYQHLTDRSLASRTKGFVEFVDFGPTVLNLAGLDPPKGIDGEAFLGKGVSASDVDARQEAFGYADRFDEKYDLVRTLRQGRYKYIRNFEPFLPDALQNNYRYKMLAFQEWRQMYVDGKLNPTQSQFFEPKAAEALYDLGTDPHETYNLADDPQYEEQLIKMRTRLTERLKEMPDLSFMTEALLLDSGFDDPVKFGQENREEITKLIDTVNLALLPWEEAEPKIREALEDDDWLVRYWAVVAGTSFGTTADSLAPEMELRMVDLEPLVSMRAVEFIAIAGASDPRPLLYRSLQRATNEPEALRMLNTAIFLHDHMDGRFPIETDKVQLLFEPKPRSEIQRRLDYLSR